METKIKKGTICENVRMRWPRSKAYVHMKRPRSGPVKHKRIRIERKEEGND